MANLILPNSSFQFKQFLVQQEGSTLKVCTDSCLFGAWVATIMTPARFVLDIGTGTGLLALMLAQRQTESEITALEIDAESAQLAQLNVSQSPWSERVKVENMALQNFKSTCYFDTLISNPPFFENHLLSDKSQRNLAKHQSGLTKEELLDNALRLLSAQGHFYVLFPDAEGKSFQHLAETKGIFLSREVIVRNKKEGPIFRRMQEYGFETKETQQSELVIYQAHQQYTEEFIALLKPYYLYL